MPVFEFKSPEGKTYQITGPEGATQEQAFQILQQQIGAGTAQEQKPKKSIGKEFIESFTPDKDSSVQKYLSEGMLGRVGKGIGEAVARKTLSKEDYARIVRQEKEPKPETKQPTIAESFKQLKDFAVEHPGATVAEFIKAIPQDPELLFPFLGEAGGATKVAQIVGKLAGRFGTTAEKAAVAGAKVATVGAKGAAAGGGMEAAAQGFEGKFNPSSIASTAIMMGVLPMLHTGTRMTVSQYRALAAEGHLKPMSEERAVDLLKQMGVPEEANVSPKDLAAEINRQLGIKTYAEVKQTTESRRKDVKQAFKDTGEADYLEFKAREREQFTQDYAKRQEELAAKKQAEELAAKKQATETAQKEELARKEADVEAAWNKYKQNPNISKEDAFAQAERERSIQQAKDKIEAELDSLTYKLSKPRVGTNRNMKGQADPEVLAAIGLVGGGAAIGYALGPEDQKLESAIAGGVGGLVAKRLPQMVEAFKKDWRSASVKAGTTAGIVGGVAALDENNRAEGLLIGSAIAGSRFARKVAAMPTDEYIKLRNGELAVSERQAWQLKSAFQTLVPDISRREAISSAIEKNDLSGLNAKERLVANTWKGISNEYARLGKDAGLINGFIENYVSHVVQKKNLPQSKVKEFLSMLGLEEQQGLNLGQTSTKSKFGKERKYATFEELQNALKGTDLEIKTRDIAEIAEIYKKSMDTAIANKNLIEQFKKTHIGDKNTPALISTSDKGGFGYQSINHPQMRGYLVHPDVKDALQFVFDARDRNSALAAAKAVSMATKRLNVSISYFHAASLLQAAIQSGYIGGKSGVDAALKQFKEGMKGDFTDKLLKSGLKVDPPTDVNPEALTQLGALLDDTMNKALGTSGKVGEKTLGFIEDKQRKLFDRVTWDYLHTGLKLAVATEKYNQAMLRNEKLPPEKRLSEQQILEGVSSYTNDTFGGLDWFRVMSESQTAGGRWVASKMLKPGSRDFLQVMMFAPDWTISTVRAMTKALPGSTSNPVNARLAQQYAFRTALIYGILMNAANYQLSGHSIFENKDPTKLDLGDGRKMQVSKHAMEFPEWLHNPRQTMLNKMGWLPKEILTQAFNKEYLSASGKAPPMDSRLKHILKGATPIGAQGLSGGGTVAEKATRLGLGTFGMPIYGYTKEQMDEMKRNKKKKKE